MNTSQKAARGSGNYTRAKTSTSRDRDILADYERGTRIAGWLFCAMFAFLAFGAVVFGW